MENSNKTHLNAKIGESGLPIKMWEPERLKNKKGHLPHVITKSLSFSVIPHYYIVNVKQNGILLRYRIITWDN